MEWIDPNTGNHFGLNAGLRIFGSNDSRGSELAKHGLRFLFKGEYGPKQLEYPVFVDAAVEQARTNPALLPTLKAEVDVENLIDYMLMVFYMGSRDGPTSLEDDCYPHNFYGVAKTAQAGPFQFFPWNMEWVLENPWENRVTHLGGENNPGLLFQVLGQDPEFRMAVADRIQKHFFGQGALTVAQAKQRYLDLASLITQAMVGESARWGDAKSNEPMTRDNEWLAEVDRIVNDYMVLRTGVVVDQLKAEEWYPAVAAPTFTVDGQSQQGGQVVSGASLSMTVDVDTIYYTSDGSDPRDPGAQIYTLPLLLTETTSIKARAFNGQWSALSEATFVVGSLDTDLHITEIMFDAEDPNTEFIELANIGTESLSLNQLSFTQGIYYTFDGGMLAAGERGVLVRDTIASIERYGAEAEGVILGQYQGSLNNQGERLLLVRDPVVLGESYVLPPFVTMLQWPIGFLGNGGDTLQLDRPGEKNDSGNWEWVRVDRVIYSDGSHPAGTDHWPVAADGRSQALHRVNVAAYGNDPANWQSDIPTPGY